MNNKKKKSLGKILIKYRKKLNFTRKDIADKLCLKLELIRNIENNILFNNIPLVFYCGYIYSYARLVNLPKKKIDLFLNEYKIKYINLTDKFIKRKKLNINNYSYLNIFFMINFLIFLFIFFLKFLFKIILFNN